MILFDTHAHYDDKRFLDDRDQVLTSLASAGVSYTVNIGADMPSSRQSLVLAEKYPFMYAALGVHPHDAKHLKKEDLTELEHMLSHPKAVALGEIGLDYHYDLSDRAVQREAFAMQLDLAERLSVPVVIHEREAAQDTLDILSKYRLLRFVYHCYSGSAETAKELVKMGGYLSFTGVITFKNARRAAEVIASVPDERIMIETDCPYLTPEPFRGKRNDSRYLHLVCEKVAQVRGISPEQAAAMTTENAKRFYSIQ